MRLALALAAATVPMIGWANDQEIQRALVQRDQMTAEFAAGVRGGDRAALENLHARQRLEVAIPGVERHLQPYQRLKMAEERQLVLPPPVIVNVKAERPLPLPRGPEHVVDPIPAQGTPH